MRLEICKESGESCFAEVDLVDGKLQVKEGKGIRGEYLPENIQCRYIEGPHKYMLLKMLEEADIYSWPDKYPEDYVPDENTDTYKPGTWTLKMTARKDQEKPWIIYGKGSYPTKDPFDRLPLLIFEQIGAFVYVDDEDEDNKTDLEDE